MSSVRERRGGNVVCGHVCGLDVFENDPQFGNDSAALLEKLLADGLAVSPVIMI